ncbi:MAG: autotransporter outer membrane beta-barrel domain-containing protein [Burkholderiales bacterium]|nr:autotransporter outer membrane beta-barrel domain-containing protein [Burkholderiales bacterium]
MRTRVGIDAVRVAAGVFACVLVTTAQAACLPWMNLTSLGRLEDGSQTVWRVSNRGDVTERVRLFSNSPGYASGYFAVDPGSFQVLFSPVIGVHRLTDGCGQIAVKAPGNQIYRPPEIVDPGGPGVGEAIASSVAQATFATYLTRSATISDRLVTGLAVRDELRADPTAAVQSPWQVAQAPGANASDARDAGASGPPMGATGLWSVWADAQYTTIDDQRYGQSTSGRVVNGTVGVDRLFGDRLVGGVAMANERYNLTAYAGQVGIAVDGVTVGPYLGWKVTDTVVADAWVGYGRFDNALDLPASRADYSAARWFGSANLTTVADLGWIRLRPKATLFGSRDCADAFVDSLGFAAAGSRFSFGSAEASLEANRIFDPGPNLRVLPFVRVAVRNDFQRPLDGDLILADGTRQSTSPWGGTVRVGVRMLLDRRITLDASAAYNSVFQNDLKIVSTRVALTAYF